MTVPILRPPGDFAPQTVIKVERLLEILGEINEHRYLGPRLALHGGTALNVFHLGIPRLSVDIDVMYIGGVAVDTMLSERGEVREELERLVQRLGYTHNSPKEEHAGVTYRLTYRSDLGQDTIKVDLNFLNRAPVLGHELVTCPQCEPQVEFNVVPYVELVAGKIKALVERRSAVTRDLYDVYLASATDFEDWPLLQAVIVYYWTLSEPFPRLPLSGAVADRFLGQESGLESDLFPVLLPTERPGLSTMIQAVASFIDRLAQVSPEQQEYMNLMAQTGTYRPELIFAPWPEVLERARVSPAAQWKVENLQKRGRPS